MADGQGGPPDDPSRARRSRAERTASGHRAKAASDAAVFKLTAELEKLNQELQDLRAVFGDSELAQRLLLVAPVLAAKLDGRETEGMKVARRNAAAHNFEVPARRLANASQRELDKIQRGGSTSEVQPRVYAGDPTAAHVERTADICIAEAGARGDAVKAVPATVVGSQV